MKSGLQASSKDRDLQECIKDLEKRLEIMEKVVKSQSRSIRQGSMFLLIMVMMLAIVIALFLSIRQDIRLHIPDEL